MAGDWIKMRSNLWDDPRISSLCDLTGCREADVIGGLYWLWATADQHSEDGIMHGLTMQAVDRKTGIAGMAAALVSIGWLADHPEGVRLTRFDEHNGASAKSRAQTAKRVANHKSNAPTVTEALPDRYPSVSAALPREREEKKREEKTEEQKQKAPAQPSVVLPDWMPLASWSGYLEMRKKKRKEPTTRAIELLIADLQKMKDAGQDISAVLDKSTVNGWTDVYPMKTEQQARASPGMSQLGKAGQATAANAQRLMEKWRLENEQAG